MKNVNVLGSGITSTSKVNFFIIQQNMTTLQSVHFMISCNFCFDFYKKRIKLITLTLKWHKTEK